MATGARDQYEEMTKSREGAKMPRNRCASRCSAPRRIQGQTREADLVAEGDDEIRNDRVQRTASTMR